MPTSRATAGLISAWVSLVWYQGNQHAQHELCARVAKGMRTVFDVTGPK